MMLKPRGVDGHRDLPGVLYNQLSKLETTPVEHAAHRDVIGQRESAGSVRGDRMVRFIYGGVQVDPDAATVKEVLRHLPTERDHRDTEPENGNGERQRRDWHSEEFRLRHRVLLHLVRLDCQSSSYESGRRVRAVTCRGRQTHAVTVPVLASVVGPLKVKAVADSFEDRGFLGAVALASADQEL